MMKSDWIEVKLKDVSVKITDGTHKTPKYQNGGIRFISIKNIKPYKQIDWNSYEKFITQKEHLTLIKRAKPEKDDILFPRIGTLGFAKRVDWDEEFSIFVGLGLIKPQKKIVYPKYLENYMNSPVIHRLSFKKATGSGRLTLPLAESKLFPMPLAPRPEQRAIVAKIEQLFSDLDNGIANLKSAQEQLKVYRQAVLKKAFEGEVVSKSIKNKLSILCSKIGSGSTPKGGNSSYKDMGIPLVRSLNIHFDFIKYEGLVFIDEFQAEKLKNVVINKGDVLLNITGASIGRVNIAPKEFQNGRVNQHVSIIRPKDKVLIPKYLKYYLQSPVVQKWISHENYGVTRQALTKGMLENLEIPMCSIAEQSQIVQEIESRLSVCDKLEESIKENLQKSEALRQSILKKAFEGKLLSVQELHACRNEPDWEPAEKLLERIKQVKADAG